MNRQHFTRRQRWKINKNTRKRRVNLYFLEQRVQKLENHREMAILDSENTQDLMKALEIKVNAIVEENKQLKAKGQPAPSLLQRMWQMLSVALSQKGQP